MHRLREAVAALKIPAMPEQQYAWVGTKHFLANAALVQNLTRSPDLIGPLWSLPWEIQMYAVLPLFWVLSRKLVSVRASIGLCALTFALELVGRELHWRGTWITQYVPCFLGGILAYQIAKSKKSRVPGWLWPPTVALSLVLFSAAWVRPSGGAWVTRNALAEYLLCLALGLAIPCFRDIPKSHFTGVCHEVAKYSYGVYLFHVPVMWLAFYRFPTVPTPLQWMLFCLGSVGVPYAAYHLIEGPMIGFGKRIADRITASGL